MLKLHNTLSNIDEEFHPLEEGVVRFYTCGPTVYDYAHVGNFRTFVFQDLLRRYLTIPELSGNPRDEHHGRRRQNHSERPQAGHDV